MTSLTTVAGTNELLKALGAEEGLCKSNPVSGCCKDDVQWAQTGKQ